MKNKSWRKLSKISKIHYIKLVKRGFLLVLTVILYLVNLKGNTDALFGGLEDFKWYLAILWLMLLVEMIMRLFPRHEDCAGCRKHLKKYFMPVEKKKTPILPSWKQTFAVAAAWAALNGVFALLYYTGVIDAGVLVILSVAYSLCDMICILFFCPFQTIFLRNRCCATCRIYNWDFFMMATPLFFIPNVFTGLLCLVSLVILLCWEIPYHRYPQRFSDETNACLSCANCSEKLCHHKKHLRHFWKSGRVLGKGSGEDENRR